MLSPSKSREALPTTTHYMSSSQLADYLTDLRAARAARVNSARSETSPTRSVRRRSPERSPERSESRPLHGLLINDSDQTLDERRREQEEVLSLRMALEKIDLEDEKSMFDSARSDALEMMLDNPSRMDGDTRTPSPAPSADVPAAPRTKTSPNGVGKPDRIQFVQPPAATLELASRTISDAPESPQTYTKTFKKKGYQGLARAVAADIANSRRRISSGTRRKPSANKNVFPSARDKIYEEPNMRTAADTEPVPEIPRHIRKNPFARVKFQQDRAQQADESNTKRSEHKPPPRKLTKQPLAQSQSQSQKPTNKTNEAPKPSPVSTEASENGKPRRDSKDIPSDELKAATSQKQTEKSASLPRPVLVSDRSERPVMQFQQPRATTAGNDSVSRPVSRNQQHIHPAMRTPSYPQIRVPSLPAIAVPEEIPVPAICISGDANSPVSDASNMVIPTITFPDDGANATQTPSEAVDQRRPGLTQTKSQPPIPSISISDDNDTDEKQPVKAASNTAEPPRRPMMQHAATLPALTDAKPYMPPRSATQNPSLCGQCALPISGRVLSAAGERLHPECFKCHQCSTNLECVAFYPEPDQRYYERIARIQQRLSGLEVGVPVDMKGMDAAALEEDDGDDSLRYFCHLDFHELFSPRCKSCKTPIEGEVVVACGAEWHVGHFFCAQCGDPFDADKPFIEQDNYAWCVGCHTNRFSPKCKKCKKPVTDLVLNALDAEWHGECFCCVECGDQFEDGRFFLRGQSKDPMCVKCEDRRLKA